MDLRKRWRDCSFVAFDTETSGGYPLGYDVVEFGAVKWEGGKEVARIQHLFKPREPMSDFIISIHGITNEMVAHCPPIQEKIREIHEFFAGSVLIAHHAPFDLGFMAIEFEKERLPFPLTPILCSSLLSRKLIPEVSNHKLQTLVGHLKINGGSAHRALDDARSCLAVAIECFKRKGPDASISDLQNVQHKSLSWENYSMIYYDSPIVKVIIQSIYDKMAINMIYLNSKQKEEMRMVRPLGVVRNPDGDYMYAFCYRDASNKRFYIEKISKASIVDL